MQDLIDNPEIILGMVFFIIIIVAIIIYSKKTKERKAKEEKLRKERMQEKEKQDKQEARNALSSWKKKLNSKPEIQKWIDEVVMYCKIQILNNVNRNYRFEFFTFNQEFAIGYNFQRHWYPNLKQSSFIKKPIYVKIYRFAEYGLPDFENDTDANSFAIAFTNIVCEKLKEEGFDCTAKGRRAQIVYDTDTDMNYEYIPNSCKRCGGEHLERCIYDVRYSYKKVEGKW